VVDNLIKTGSLVPDRLVTKLPSHYLSRDSIQQLKACSTVALKHDFRLSIFHSWVSYWIRCLSEIVSSFGEYNGDTKAFELFKRNQTHFIALFDQCMSLSPSGSRHCPVWCYGVPSQNVSPTKPFALSFHEIADISDLLCDSSFFSFVLVAPAHVALLEVLRTETLRHYDMRRYARLLVAVSWQSLEVLSHSFISISTKTSLMDSIRTAKEDTETAEKLFHPMLALRSVHTGRVDSTLDALELDHCDALNVLGFSLLCLGCDGPAKRKHGEALLIANRFANPWASARSEALHGVAHTSLDFGGGEEPEEALRCLLSALKKVEDSFGPNHVLTIWLLELSSFFLSKVSKPTEPEGDALAMAIRGVQCARSKLEPNHVLTGFACASATKVAIQYGQHVCGLELAEESAHVFRSVRETLEADAMPFLQEHIKTIDKDAENCRRKSRRSTRMGQQARR